MLCHECSKEIKLSDMCVKEPLSNREYFYYHPSCILKVFTQNVKIYEGQLRRTTDREQKYAAY
jgi:hypothetical protein